MKRVLIGLAAMAMSGAATAQEVKRLDTPGSTFPIAAATLVPANAELMFVSGLLPDVADPAAPKGTPEAYGSTEAQARSVLGKIEAVLKREGLGLGDIVQMRVFLVGDAKLGGRMDFEGLMKAYGPLFGTAAQPNKPARTVVQVVALPAPGALVEIDVVAAKVSRP